MSLQRCTKARSTGHQNNLQLRHEWHKLACGHVIQIDGRISDCFTDRRRKSDEPRRHRCATCLTPEQRRQKIVDMAHTRYHREGVVEVDRDAKLSEAEPEDDENGCYVQAWVWVNFSGSPFDKHPDED